MSSNSPPSTAVSTNTNNNSNTNTAAAPKKKLNPVQQLIAGGCAGFVESSVCHPLDTIKTRMQLRRQSSAVDAARIRHSLVEPALRLKHSLQEPLERLRHSMMEPNVALRHSSTATVSNSGGGALLHEPGFGRLTNPTSVTKPPPSAVHKATVTASLGPLGTARRIIQREGFTSLYKGLTAVWTGIIPKMAIRFVSFEQYKDALIKWNNNTSSNSIVFVAGLGSGLTEAIMVVTPAEVCKIRMQSQYHSLMDPTQKQHRKYTHVVQTAYVIVKEEGIAALYKGVVPTMLRQGCNQAVNFTAYQWLKRNLLAYQQQSNPEKTELASWQSLLLGGFSGGMGPLVNNPLDVVKTRMQKQVIVPGKAPKYNGLVSACFVIAKDEGVMALWKGITPRLLRIVPGQAITFMTYEFCSEKMHRWGLFESIPPIPVPN